MHEVYIGSILERYNLNYNYGKYLSLVEYLVWDQGVAGSNPVFPTIKEALASFLCYWIWQEWKGSDILFETGFLYVVLAVLLLEAGLTELLLPLPP